MVSWCFIRFSSSSVFFCCSICFGSGLFRLFLWRWVLSCLDILLLEMSILQMGHSTFSFCFSSFFLCIVHSVPALFVAILLYGFLYTVVYIHSVFDITPFHCQSFPEFVSFYILNISYLDFHSLKFYGAISLNGFLGLKDYFIIYFIKILWINHQV